MNKLNDLKFSFSAHLHPPMCIHLLSVVFYSDRFSVNLPPDRNRRWSTDQSPNGLYIHGWNITCRIKRNVYLRNLWWIFTIGSNEDEARQDANDVSTGACVALDVGQMKLLTAPGVCNKSGDDNNRPMKYKCAEGTTFLYAFYTLYIFILFWIVNRSCFIFLIVLSVQSIKRSE